MISPRRDMPGHTLIASQIELHYPNHPIYEGWGRTERAFSWRFSRVSSCQPIPGIYSIRRVQGGSLEYRIDGRLHRVCDGEFLLMTPDAEYRVSSVEKTATVADGIYFPLRLGDDALRAACPYPHVVRAGKRLATAYRHQLHCALAEGTGVNVDRQESLLILVRELIRQQAGRTERLRKVLPGSKAATVQRNRRHLDWARDYIDANLDHSVTLDEVASAACISPFHLMRLFRIDQGVSIGGYLQRCRCERACTLLRNTKQPVSRIALEVGFSHESSFSRFFRCQTGMSPRVYRTEYH